MAIVSTTTKLKTRDYVDLDISFMNHPVKKDVLTKVGDKAVTQALKNLVLTNFYERPFQPSVGCNVRKMLFENMTPGIALTIKDIVKQTIENFEKRVSLIDIIVNPLYDENKYELLLYFFINNREEPTAINIFLDRVR